MDSIDVVVVVDAVGRARSGVTRGRVIARERRRNVRRRIGSPREGREYGENARRRAWKLGTVDVDVEDAVGEDGDGAKSALRVGASEVYSESVGETERRRRDQSARLENSHASHWAALAGNARAITGDAPR